MDHTHEYDCIVCGAHFDTSKDLAQHNEKAHLSTATGMERPRSTTPGDDKARIPGHEHDRNPGQGFVDPRTDRSQKT